MENPPQKPAKSDLPAEDPLADDRFGGEMPDIVDLVMEMGQPAATPRGRVPAHVEELVETAREYADNASSQNTRDAYAKDWKHFSSWCRRTGFEPLPPDSKVIGLYIGACAAGGTKLGGPALSVATIERRLSGLAWNFTQRGLVMDRADRHIATVLAGIRRTHARPPRVKEAVLGDDLIAMLATLGHDLRGLRDRAILLLGFAGGLRRSEIVSLDVTRDDDSDGAGWIEILPGKGVLVTLRGKCRFMFETGTRVVSDFNGLFEIEV